MPRLLLFAPCENVIVGQDNNAASLIILLHQITMAIPEQLQTIPPRAASQLKWYVFAQWEISPDEVSVRFEQKVQLVDPSGQWREDFSSIADFTPELDKPINRMIATITFFPLVPPGDYRLQLSVRRVGENVWPEPVGDYPIEVIHQRVGQLVPQQ